MSDSPGACATLRFSDDSVALPASERVSRFELSTGLVASEYVVADYDYKTASTSNPTSTAQTHGAAAVRYAFRGRDPSAWDGARAAALQLAAQQMDQQTGHAAGAHASPAGSAELGALGGAPERPAAASDSSTY
jgi:uncharacterized protein involved in type VI secretion and phage assembly